MNSSDITEAVARDGDFIVEVSVILGDTGHGLQHGDTARRDPAKREHRQRARSQSMSSCRKTAMIKISARIGAVSAADCARISHPVIPVTK